LDYPSINAIKEFNKRIVKERNETYSLEDPKQLEVILKDTQNVGEDLPIEHGTSRKPQGYYVVLLLLNHFMKGIRKLLWQQPRYSYTGMDSS
jgi:hypothetical protein